MRTPKELERKSVLLSGILRHFPKDYNITLSLQGWARVEDILVATGLSQEELDHIVATDEKGRYTMRGTSPNSFIRANQGHSTPMVDLTFDQGVPPPILYHGTKVENRDNILRQGLLAGERHYVHLSVDRDTAVNVGNRRRSETIVFAVDCERMTLRGREFFVSENGVWLVRDVPPEFLTEDV